MIRSVERYSFDCGTDYGKELSAVLAILTLKAIDLFFKAGTLPIDAKEHLNGTLKPARSKNNGDYYSENSKVIELLIDADRWLYPNESTDLETYKANLSNIAIAIAILSFQPEGILFWGIHYENQF